MPFDLEKFLEEQKSSLEAEKKAFNLSKIEDVVEKNDAYDDDNDVRKNCRRDVDENEKNLSEENKENIGRNCLEESEQKSLHKSVKDYPVEKLNLNQLDDVEKKKNDDLSSFLTNSSNDRRCAMLRYGEYSPNNPELRVTSKPFLGIGEYEQQQILIRERRKKNLSNVAADKPKSKIQYDRQNRNEAQKELSPQRASEQKVENNRELTSYRRTDARNDVDDANHGFVENCLQDSAMDKPKGILTNRKTGTSRDRFMSNLKHSYTPSFMDGFSYTDRTEEIERERKKREAYSYELRMQIEEKRRLQAIKDEQDRREQELENRRLEQQLLRMQEEALVDDPKSCRNDDVRRHSEDYMRRNDFGMRSSFRKHSDSESSTLMGGARNAHLHYSPPVSRRTPFSLNVPQTSVYSDSHNSRYNSRYDTDMRHRRDALNRMDSLNVYDSLYDAGYRRKRNAFARFDSLSRIDAADCLNKFDALTMDDDLTSTARQRRHSATQHDYSARRSPKLTRRSNSSRFDDQLPIPVLKARSPVARELKNSIPFNSGSRTPSESCRRLEDKWQIPAVQKNIVNHSDGSNRNLLTQLGAIRMQLQQEQLRMDESLRKRGITQSKAVDFH